MRKILAIYIGLIVACLLTPLQAQNLVPEDEYDQFGNQIDPSMIPDKLDSANVRIKSLPPTLYMWHIKDELGGQTIVPADTMALNFQNTSLTDGSMGHYNFLANMGAPRLSRIFFERREATPTIFMEPFSSFFVQPTEFYFTNSNVPFTNLTYHKAGNKITGEERFKSYFSVNVNKALAFGFNVDYLYGRGYYNNQNTSYFNGALFGSYMGDHYQIQGIYNNYSLKTNENGGIEDDRYITEPEEMAEGQREYESTNIPTILNASANRNHDFYLHFTHRYNLGFHRDIPQEENDTTPPKQEFVPVTSFIHTIHVERARHTFHSQDNVGSNYYRNTYYDEDNYEVTDSTLYLSVKNTVGIALLEGFNKYAKAGLTVFASHKFSRYTLTNLNGIGNQKYTENEIYIGGELSKREGNLLHYHAIGEIGLIGEAAGQFDVKGDIDLNFSLGRDTVSLVARGAISNKLASFYMRHYHSKHFLWDDDMDKEFRFRIEGELSIARWKTHLRVGMENVKNYTYFNQYALPEQKSGSIQVLSACLNQDFKLGFLHLDNEVTWQKSSDQSVLPLPDFSLYHNFYLLFKFVKVLTIQAGADLRYFTKYYAPAYMPATEQFHLQPEDDLVEIGKYPVINAYINLHLKRTRFYVMMSHVNKGMGDRNYFLVPHYPLNPRLIRFGISWNFYD